MDENQAYKMKLTKQRKQFKDLKLMGVSDISKLYGWTPSKITLYTQRGKFPQPIGEVGGRPAWLKDQIEPYFIQKAQEQAQAQEQEQEQE